VVNEVVNGLFGELQSTEREILWAHIEPVYQMWIRQLVLYTKTSIVSILKRNICIVQEKTLEKDAASWVKFG
jgi:hypothetical protein